MSRLIEARAVAEVPGDRHRIDAASEQQADPPVAQVVRGEGGDACGDADAAQLRSEGGRVEALEDEPGRSPIVTRAEVEHGLEDRRVNVYPAGASGLRDCGAHPPVDGRGRCENPRVAKKRRSGLHGWQVRSPGSTQ